MQLKGNLPRGCPTIRGASDIVHLKSLGGPSAQQANRMYMLTVRRESLMSKRQSLVQRIHDIDTQLKGIEKDLRAFEMMYRNVLKLPRSKKMGAALTGAGRKEAKRMSLKF
ncbi:MAG: hypothetical protein HYT77_06785 [Deltaproteobacteria bacterium]|nr:hypothetical protein [Deltaproteobacteria bacterium]